METNFVIFFSALWVRKYGVEGKAKVEKPKCCYRMATCLLLLLKEHSTHSWCVDSTIQSNWKICLFIWKLYLKWGSNSFQQPREHSSWETLQPGRATYIENFVLYTFSTQNLMFPLLFQKWNATKWLQWPNTRGCCPTQRSNSTTQIIIHMQIPHIFQLDWFSNFLFYFLVFWYPTISLELRDLLACASQMLWSKAHTIMPSIFLNFSFTSSKYWDYY